MGNPRLGLGNANAMDTKAKVLFVGLDGIEPELALKMCDDGDLPVLQSMR